jgi:ribosome-associated protein
MVARSVSDVLQGMNKVATAIQLRFDVLRSSLPADVKDRLVKLAGNRVTEAGVLLIDARVYRTQEQNKVDAIHRLVAMIQKAMLVPKVRKAIRPSGAGRAREKQRRSETKRIRRYTPDEWE